MNNAEDTCTCTTCGKSLAPDYKGACPYCGGLLKNRDIVIKDTGKGIDFVKLEKRREYFEKNPKVKWILILLSILSPPLGLILKGVLGLIIGFVISALAYYLGPYAITRVKEIEREVGQ